MDPFGANSRAFGKGPPGKLPPVGMAEQPIRIDPGEKPPGIDEVSDEAVFILAPAAFASVAPAPAGSFVDTGAVASVPAGSVFGVFFKA